MLKTLRESKAHLSELVRLAEQGEEIIITVHGKPKARLGPVGPPSGEGDRRQWTDRLREDRAKYTVNSDASSGTLLDELREDRL